MTLDRRALLKLLGTVTLTSVTSPTLGLQQAATAEAPAGLPGVEVQAIQDLAKAYLEHGSDPEVAQMVQRLKAQPLSDDRIAEELRAEMADDFAEGRLVALHGWQVSRTEARLFAAASELLG